MQQGFNWTITFSVSDDVFRNVTKKKHFPAELHVWKSYTDNGLAEHHNNHKKTLDWIEYSLGVTADRL